MDVRSAEMIGRHAQQNIGWTHAVYAWGPVIAYMTIIFFASAQPDMPLEGRTSLSDKAIHAGAYFGLTMLAYRGALMVSLGAKLTAVPQAMLVSMLHGLSDEAHQYFVPGRNAELNDWLADATGTLAAVSLIVLIGSILGNGGTTSVRGRKRL